MSHPDLNVGNLTFRHLSTSGRPTHVPAVIRLLAAWLWSFERVVCTLKPLLNLIICVNARYVLCPGSSLSTLLSEGVSSIPPAALPVRQWEFQPICRMSTPGIRQ